MVTSLCIVFFYGNGKIVAEGPRDSDLHFGIISKYLILPKAFKTRVRSRFSQKWCFQSLSRVLCHILADSTSSGKIK